LKLPFFSPTNKPIEQLLSAPYLPIQNMWENSMSNFISKPFMNGYI